jgi:hypothetical protein
VSLDVDRAGKPTVTGVQGCEDPFAWSAKDSFSQWRFKPCTIDGRQAEGSITLAASFPASDFQKQNTAAYDAIMSIHSQGPTAASGCLLSMTIYQDGTIAELQSSDLAHCLVVPGRAPMQTTLGLEEPVSCEVSLTAEQGVARGSSVKASGCSKSVEKYLELAFKGMAWNAPIGTTESYTITVNVGELAPWNQAP